MLLDFFGKPHEKSQEHNHVLAPIVGKELQQKFLLGIALGVLEGLINRGFFWFSILTPSSVQCSLQFISIRYLDKIYQFMITFLKNPMKQGKIFFPLNDLERRTNLLAHQKTTRGLRLIFFFSFLSLRKETSEHITCASECFKMAKSAKTNKGSPPPWILAYMKI